ncbi:hypothetical protein SME36J_50380 (plasmid) [Serratia marcescens]|nr:hypothetical protein SME36J_50380 [Serratia marcescens]
MTERKMTVLYVFLLLAWWGGWLALDVWRIEHLLTDADKWAGFRRDILWCAGLAVVSVIFLLGLLAAAVGISAVFVVSDAFIHWRFDMSLLSMSISVVQIAMVPMLPFVAFLMLRT